MASCRLIISPKTGKEVISKTWSDIRALVDSDERADELYQQLLSPEFMQFFGNWVEDPENASKVVTEDGEPKIVYHGSNNEKIEIFNTAYNRAGKALYFTPDFEYAGGYRRGSASEKINPETGVFEYNGFRYVFRFSKKGDKIFLKKPVNAPVERLSEESADKYRITEDEYEKAYYGLLETGKVYPVFLNIRSAPTEQDAWFGMSRETLEKEYGRYVDGFFTNDDGGRLNIIGVFDSSQIKSVFNQGSFSSNTGNIFSEYNNFNDGKETNQGGSLPASDRKINSRLAEGFRRIQEIPIRRAVGNIKKDKNILFGDFGTSLPDRLRVSGVGNMYGDSPGTMLFGSNTSNIQRFRSLPQGADFQMALGQSDSTASFNGSILSLLVAQSLSESGGGQLGQLLMELSRRVNVGRNSKMDEGELSGFRVVINTNIEDKNFNYNPEKNIIHIGAGGLQARLINRFKGNRKQFLEWLPYALEEEVIHAIAGNIISKDEIEAIYNEMGEPLIEAVVEGYAGEKVNSDNFYKAEIVHEYLRQVVQRINSGATTQEARFTIIGKVIDALKKVVDFILDTVKGKPLALSAVTKIQDFIAGKEIPIVQNRATNINIREYQSEELKQKQQSIANSFQQKRDKYNVQKIEGSEQPTSDDEETNGYKRTLNGGTDWVRKRVTDFVKELKSAQTLAKFEKAPAEKKKEWKEKAQYGTKFHKDAESVIRAALDSEGYLKPHDQINFNSITTTLPSSIKEPLIAYLIGTKTLPGILYTQFTQGTLFKVEEILYDEKRDVAGTVDLLGIAPDGKIHIWDWKTKFLNKQYFDDVPFFSQRDYRVQLGQYKNVLKTYGIKPEDVVVAQAQPVVFEGSVSKSGDVSLKSVELPAVDIKAEGRKYLIPVSVQEQSTGNEAVDAFIKSLYKLYEDVYRTPSQDKYLKIQQLNSIATAIRELQIKQNFAPVTQEANTFMLSVDRAIKDYSDLFKGDVAPGFENLAGGKEAFDNLLSRTTTILENIDKYAGLYGMFQDIYGSEDLTEEQKKVQESLQKISGAAAYQKSKIEGAFRGMMQWFASSYGVERILDNEKTVTGVFDRNVQSTSKIQTYAIELFYKLESEAKSRRDVAIQEKLSSFQKVLEPFKKYAAAKGLSPRNFFSLVTGDKNSNKLLPKLKEEVYTLLEKATDPSKAVDKKWLEENVNMDRVREIAGQKIEARNQAIDKETDSLDPEEDNAIKKRKKADYAAQWDFSENGLGWFQKDELRRNIREELWYTEEYQKIRQQPEVLALYQWIEEFNFEALKSGYHDNTQYFSKRFLPWVRGSFLDKLGKKGLSAFSDRARDLWTLHEDEKQVYGAGDELKLPRFFTRDERTNKESLEELSTDIGSNMALYIQAVLDYQAMSEIEDYADAILTLEKGKDHLKVDRNGKIVVENGRMQTEQGNEENARLLNSQVEMLLYKRNYDKTSGLPEEANKTIEAVNNFMRLKVFSLNFIMPFVNTVGSNLQAGINSGRLFKGREWLKNEARLVGNLFQEQEGNLVKGLVDYFMPLLENENHRSGKQLSVQALKKWTIGDVLLGHIRKADRVIQLTTAMTMLENTMVDAEGNLVNIREHYLNSKEYRERYKLPLSERKTLERGFEQKVKELKDQYSIVKKAKFNQEGILEIEGVSRDSETYHQYRRKIQNEISSIVGQVSEDEKRDMERNIFLKSMMMFKSWIPNLTEKRIGHLKKNARTNQYEIGRARVFFEILFKGTGERTAGNIFTGAIQGLRDLRDMKMANERGVQLLQEYYQRKAQDYFEKTGKELQLTPEEFYDLTRQAITMQVKDFIAVMSLILMGVGLGAVPPDDEADKGAKNIYRNLSRIADKLKDEVTFYYNPLSATTILGGGVMPSIGVLTDGLKTLGTLAADLTGDEKKQENTHSIKAILRNFPITYQATQFFLPLISPETADDLGVKVASNNNYR